MNNSKTYIKISWKETLKVVSFSSIMFIFLYYKCRKINPNRGGSYIDSLDWIKIKNATTNPISKRDNKGFKYTATVAVNHEEIEEHFERATKIKLWNPKCNWEGASEKGDWRKVKKNNVTIALNVSYAKKKKYIQFQFQNITRIIKKKIILLMIPNRKGRSYLAVEELSALSRGITSKHDSNYYCLNCLCSNLNLKKVCKNNNFCNVVISSQGKCL